MNMRNKEKARQYNLLYRQQHKVAIRIKNRIYKRLPHVKTRSREARRRYFQKYYKSHRSEILQRAKTWVQNNRDKRHINCKRYKEKLKMRNYFSGPKIKGVVEAFLTYCKTRYHLETVRQYAMNLGRFLVYIERPGVRCKEYHIKRYHELRKPADQKDPDWQKDFWKIRLINEIDRDLIVKYIEYVNHDEVNQKGLKLSQSEKEARLYPLKTFLLYCLRKGYLKKDLRKFIFVPPRETKVSKRLLTIDEMKRLLEAPSENTTIGLRNRALLEMSYSGLRAGEILYLKSGHIDLDANSVFVFNGKGEKDRVIPMTQEAVYWMRRWLSRRCEFIKNKDNCEYVFVTKSAKPIIRKNFSVLIKKYAKKAGINIDISPHDFRRITATHLAESGAPVRMIQALLGHASLKVTTKYLKLSDDIIKKEYKETHPSNRRRMHYARVHG